MIHELKEYLHYSRLKGLGLAQSLYRLPGFYFEQKKNKKLAVPLLISYPRSGTNWVRYIIEFLSDKPTPGFTRLIEGEDFIIHRAHDGYRIIDKYKKVILIIRNYKECIIRHQGINRIREYEHTSEFLKDSSLVHPPEWYINNIQKFDKFKGKKILVYYEDLVEEPEKSITDIATFLGLKNKKLATLLDESEVHKKRSIELYNKNQQSFTSGNIDKLQHHSEMLTIEERKQFDDFFELNYRELFKKYLMRYKE